MRSTSVNMKEQHGGRANIFCSFRIDWYIKWPTGAMS